MRMENPSYSNENIDRKSIFQVKYSLLELEKYFMELKNRELKDRKGKN